MFEDLVRKNRPSCELEINARIFSHTRRAGYLQNWPSPAEGERPVAYIIIRGNSILKLPTPP